MLTAVGAPLLMKVARVLGSVGLELQLAAVVHSLPGPVQMPSVTCALVATGIASDRAPSTAANLYGLIATAPPRNPWALASHRSTARGNRRYCVASMPTRLRFSRSIRSCSL